MSDDTPTPHRRRPRYKGTHPRRFHEKYKELDPERDPAVRERVMARGKTPAGSHRSILVDEVLAALSPVPGEVALDATLGYGGHALALWERVAPAGRLIGLDVDPIELPRTRARLEAAGVPPEALVTERTNFAALAGVIAKHAPLGVNVLLADLGVSSMQIDDPARGFTFKEDGPLDLRMNPNRGEPASALLARMDARELEALLIEEADEPHAARLAEALAARARALATTHALAGAVKAALPAGLEADAVRATLQRVFQALRIRVNDEMRVLDAFLRALPTALAPGGRVAILTFHSGEDRRVKKAVHAGLRDGLYSSIADEVRPKAAEVHANPRARSAKLRWARRML
jgi:16S rRNA (cytosine1402-N4)-methyltransferase